MTGPTYSRSGRAGTLAMQLCGTILFCGIASAGLADERSDLEVSPERHQYGKAVFDQWCWHCHGKDNPHGSGTWSIRKRDGEARSPFLEDRSDLSPAYVELIVRQGQRFMPRFRYTEISDEELLALSAYLENATKKE